MRNSLQLVALVAMIMQVSALPQYGGSHGGQAGILGHPQQPNIGQQHGYDAYGQGGFGGGHNQGGFGAGGHGQSGFGGGHNQGGFGGGQYGNQGYGHGGGFDQHGHGGHGNGHGHGHHHHH